MERPVSPSCSNSESSHVVWLMTNLSLRASCSIDVLCLSAFTDCSSIPCKSAPSVNESIKRIIVLNITDSL